MLDSIKNAWDAIERDQDYMKTLFGEAFRKRGSLRAIVLNPSIRAAFWMRMSASGGLAGFWARHRLVSDFACDVGAGAVLSGALYLPHPVGIVIGRGVHISGPAAIYQGVTLGADKAGNYPRLGGNNRLFPNAIVVGGIAVGEGASIGAGVFVNSDVKNAETVRTSHR
jgi:serine O-acetyltransferase